MPIWGKTSGYMSDKELLKTEQDIEAFSRQKAYEMGRREQFNNGPGMVAMDNVARGGAKYANEVMNEDEFSKLYDKVIDFKAYYDLVGWKLPPERHTDVFASFSLDAKHETKKYVMLPLLVEKQACKLLDRSDENKLELLLDNIKLDYPDNYDEEFNRIYTSGIVQYHFLGLIDINDSRYFKNTFEKYAIFSRKEVSDMVLDFQKEVGSISEVHPETKKSLIQELMQEKREIDEELTGSKNKSSGRR